MLLIITFSCLLFFFQAEDGIRDYKVTGVQTCALPIYLVVYMKDELGIAARVLHVDPHRACRQRIAQPLFARARELRSEERRVGKECRSRWSSEHEEKDQESVMEE